MGRILFVISVVMLLAASDAGAARQAKPGEVKAAATAAAPLNLNTATTTQLEALPGIGKRTAQAIIDHRQKNGGFKKIEELMNVKGVGEKSFLKLKPMVTVSGDRNDKVR